MAVHLGKKIEEVFKEKGIKPAFFADAISTSGRNLYNVFQREDFKTEELAKISEILEHDFFKYVIPKMPTKYPEGILPEASIALDEIVDYKKRVVNLSITLDGKEDNLKHQIDLLKAINQFINNK